jgi:hypothetical protein
MLDTLPSILTIFSYTPGEFMSSSIEKTLQEVTGASAKPWRRTFFDATSASAASLDFPFG